MNYWLITILLLASGLFGLGNTLARRLTAGPGFYLFAAVGIVAAIPGVVIAAYYLKVFGEPI